ncbi:MAG TPA: M23 family metallopeptidase [Glycomyces sp.]|nr:M23 family metallopeptidase [Glycomyces sp.]
MGTHSHSDEHHESEPTTNRRFEAVRLQAERLMRRVRHEGRTHRVATAGVIAAVAAGAVLATANGQSAEAGPGQVFSGETLGEIQASWPADTLTDAVAVQRDTARAASEAAEAAEAQRESLNEAEAEAQAEAERVAAEEAAAAEAEAQAQAEAEAEAEANPDWISPSHDRITSYYGERWGRLHAGVDFANWYDDPIWAIADGKVTYAGWMDGYGGLVVVDHGDGVETAYGHASEVLVEVGDKVEQGDHLSLTGNTGNSTGPHLHFEVRIHGEQVDPLPWLEDRGVEF